jgi:hypothetical protein
LNQVNIIDAPCGYGKTSWAIQAMNEASSTHKFIYVTPFLEEIERIKSEVKNRKFEAPTTKNGETKLEDLHRLLYMGADICTTHALFKRANKETRELIQSQNYTLILDEVMDVIEQIELDNDDYNLLVESKTIFLELYKNKIEFVKWNEDKKDYQTRYDDIRNMALSGNLVFCNKSAFIWNFPVDMFSMFKHVYLLTYLFKGQKQKYYFDLHEVKYRYLSIIQNGVGYEIVPYDLRKKHNKAEIKSLIKIYEGDLNKIGEKPYSLSKTWYSKSQNSNAVKKVSDNARNFLQNMNKANSKDSMWTVFMGEKEKIKKKVQPRGFAGGFVSVSERATNKYKDRYNLAYLVNRYMHVMEERFFQLHGVDIDKDTWAISELIQWIWRSRIRDGKPITLYIPSKRMRNLLYQYLESDEFEKPPKEAITYQYDSDWTM